MSIWATLGMSPSTNPEDIERAFEQQLKFIDPGEEPERYRELRAAYEEAMLQAGAEPLDEAFGEDLDDPDAVVMPARATPEAEMYSGQVMTELESVYANPGWRDDLKRWRAQLESERAHKEGVTEVLRFRVFDFISRQAQPGNPGISPEILQYLDKRLGWRRHRKQLAKAFPEERVRMILGDPGPDSGSIGPFPDSDSGGADAEMQGPPRGLGLALIGWVVFLMILTLLFGGGGGQG